MFHTTNNKNIALVKQIEAELTAWKPEEKLLRSVVYNCVNSALYRIQHRTYRECVNAKANRSEIDSWIQTHFPTAADSLLHRKLQQLQTQDAVFIETTEEAQPDMWNQDMPDTEQSEYEDLGLNFEDGDSMPCLPEKTLYKTVGACLQNQENPVIPVSSELTVSCPQPSKLYP